MASLVEACSPLTNHPFQRGLLFGLIGGPGSGALLRFQGALRSLSFLDAQIRMQKSGGGRAIAVPCILKYFGSCAFGGPKWGMLFGVQFWL